MRVLMYAAAFPPRLGGGEIYSYYLARGLSRLCELTVVTNRILEAEPGPSDRAYRLLQLSPNSIPWYFARLRPDHRPHVLFVSLPGPASVPLVALARLRSIPSVMTCHGWYGDAKADIRAHDGPLSLWLEAFYLNLPWTRIVCVDEHSFEMLTDARNARRRTSRIIPSGVDTGAFSPAANPTELADVPRCPIVLCPRRVAAKTGIHYLVEAMPPLVRALPGLKVVVAGRIASSRYLSELRSRVRELGVQDHIEFLGSVRYEEMPALYQSADVVAIPSTAEARSLAALEAMACGKVVVASRVGGLPEIVEHGVNGLLVQPGDPDGLADAIVTAVTNRPLREKIISAGLSTARENSWHDRAESYMELFNSLNRESACRERTGATWNGLQSRGEHR